MRCKGKIITDAMNYEVVKKIMTPGSADKGSYMATMPGGSHDPQFLVSHWWGGRAAALAFLLPPRKAGKSLAFLLPLEVGKSLAFLLPLERPSKGREVLGLPTSP